MPVGGTPDGMEGAGERPITPDTPGSMELVRFAKLFDHSIVRPDATRSDVAQFADTAARLGTATLTVQPHYIRFAAARLRGSGVLLGTVVGFPHGNERQVEQAILLADDVKGEGNLIDGEGNLLLGLDTNGVRKVPRRYLGNLHLLDDKPSPAQANDRLGAFDSGHAHGLPDGLSDRCGFVNGPFHHRACRDRRHRAPGYCVGGAAVQLENLDAARADVEPEGLSCAARSQSGREAEVHGHV